jgi:hypothetical protein
MVPPQNKPACIPQRLFDRRADMNRKIALVSRAFEKSAEVPIEHLLLSRARLSPPGFRSVNTSQLFTIADDVPAKYHYYGLKLAVFGRHVAARREKVHGDTESMRWIYPEVVPWLFHCSAPILEKKAY